MTRKEQTQQEADTRFPSNPVAQSRFKDGAEWSDKTMIEKARKWFEKRNEWFDIDGNRHCDMESFEDFVNYMKGEQYEVNKEIYFV